MPATVHPFSKPESDANERARVQLRLVRMLVDELPPEVRAEFLRQIAAEVSSPDLARGDSATETIAKIISLARPGSEVTAATARKAVADRGVEAEPKHVYNALTYLKRAGKLKRVGYGRYVVEGVEFSTSDDYGGERARDEDLRDDER